MPSMSTKAPHQKVVAGALAGAVTTIAIWALKTWGKVEVTPEVGSSITVVLTFIVSYLTPPSDRDTLVAAPVVEPVTTRG